MEELRIMVQNIVVVIVLALLLELLLPAGDMRRYVHLVCGLLVIVVVFQAAGNLARVRWADFPAFGARQPIPDVVAAGIKLRDRQLGAARDSMRQALQQQIRSLVEVGGEWQVVEVEPVLREVSDNIFQAGLEKLVLTVRPLRGGRDGAVQPVEPVQMGPAGEQKLPGGQAGELAGKAVRLKQQLSGIYQLQPEQVVVRAVP
ncbi:MAG: stage III sporulation protein AF [Desulfurispora sp.]|uniref:stage III sporulation protein AF n=1 Tax=Desulfurispora sp. TaxID=3014275 RepID=UPI00404AC8C1